MGNVKTLAQQNALAAAAGNPALLELLESLMNTVTLTQQASNTTGKNVPKQGGAQVSYLKGNYIVEITNYGGASPLSNIQRAQQTQSSTQATTIQPVTAVLNQIRCATSPSFSLSSNAQTFGGDTGSTQTYWTLTNLGSGNFYFQFRSSYDGVNWNQWKNANGGQSITSFPTQITLEAATNCEWAVFTLPGNQLVAVGQGYAPDGGTFTLPENLYSSAMCAIAGPNGFLDVGRHVCDFAACNVGVVVPTDTSGTVGIPDYPVLVSMKYGDQSAPQVKWSGNANIFAFAFDPAGKNVTRYISPDGTTEWVVFTLPGGASLAVGNGVTAHGANVWFPTDLSWVAPANVLSIASPEGNPAGHSAHGIQACQLNASGPDLVAQAQYGDGTSVWTGNARWLAIASNLPVVSLSGGQWLVINLGGGNKIVFGAGQSPEFGYIDFPEEFGQNALTMATPASFSGSGDNVMHGVAQCELGSSYLPILSYSDGSGNAWGGNLNWMVFSWFDANGSVPIPPGPPATAVFITPNSASITSGLQQFTATVVNNVNPNVTWAVDGVPGGNATTGAIDVTGLYSTPAARGGHTITATSVGDPTAVGTAGIYVSA